MKKFLYALKQTLPFMYVSEYSTNGHREVAVWRQWFGKVLLHKRWTVA